MTPQDQPQAPTLRDYVQHKDECGKYPMLIGGTAHFRGAGVCTCGLDTALQQAPTLRAFFEQWRGKATEFGHHGQLGVQHHVNQLLDELEAALQPSSRETTAHEQTEDKNR